MSRRLFVSLTDEQWHFVAMNRRGSMPAFVRQLVDEAIARDRERLAPLFRQFELREKVFGLADQRAKLARQFFERCIVFAGVHNTFAVLNNMIRTMRLFRM
jgi:hypothetical protein